MSHIMISYSQTSSSDLARQLNDELKKQNYSTWIDYEKMCGYLDEAMAKAVEDASVVLVLVTNEYSKSENCKKECGYASSLRKRIIPIRVNDECDPCVLNGRVGIILSGLLYIDFSKQSFQKSMNELSKQIDNQMAIINTVKNDFKISNFTKIKYFIQRNKMSVITILLSLFVSIAVVSTIIYNSKDIQRFSIRKIFEGDNNEFKRIFYEAFDNTEFIESVIVESYTLTDLEPSVRFKNMISFIYILKSCPHKYIAFKKLHEKLNCDDLIQFAFQLKKLFESNFYYLKCDNGTKNNFNELIISLPQSIRWILFDGFVALKHKQYDQYLNTNESTINNNNTTKIIKIISSKNLVYWSFKTDDEGQSFSIYTNIHRSYLVSSNALYRDCAYYLSLSRDKDIINKLGKFKIEFPSKANTSNEIKLKVDDQYVFLALLKTTEGSHYAISLKCDLNMVDSTTTWYVEQMVNVNKSILPSIDLPRK